MNVQFHWVTSDNTKLMYCAVCKTETVHHRVGNSDVFTCWCGTTTTELQKQEELAKKIAADCKEQMEDFLNAIGWACEEPLEALGWHYTQDEGSDTSLRGSLNEAGFGDFGPM